MNGHLALRMRTRTLLTIELTFVAVGRMRSSPRRRTLEPPAAVQRVGVAFFVGLFKTLNSEQCSSTSPGQLPPGAKRREGADGCRGGAAPSLGQVNYARLRSLRAIGWKPNAGVEQPVTSYDRSTCHQL